ncbi:unnamed protein product, partial [Mycena citricolor]
PPSRPSTVISVLSAKPSPFDLRFFPSVLHEMSQLLNTQLDKETLTTCVRMIESGVNPEALAAVIQELRRENANQRSQETRAS